MTSFAGEAKAVVGVARGSEFREREHRQAVFALVAHLALTSSMEMAGFASGFCAVFDNRLGWLLQVIQVWSSQLPVYDF